MISIALKLFHRFTTSLRFKLSFYAGVLVFLSVVVFSYYSTSVQEEQLINERVRASLKDSEVIKAALWNGMMTKEREGIRQIVKAIGEQEGFEEINVYDRHGVLQYSSTVAPAVAPGDSLGKSGDPLLSNIATNTSVRHRLTDDGRLITVVNPLLNTKSCSTAGCHARPESVPVLGALEVKLSLVGLRSRIGDYARRTYVFAFVLFLLISTIVGLGVIFLVSRPIRRLEEKARKMARGRYFPDAPEAGETSIARLSRAFDEMTQQIHQRTRELEESRRMYKELFEKVPCYVTVIDRDYRIVRANEAFRAEFGDHVGRHCFTGRKGLRSKCQNCQVERTFSDGLSHRSEEVWNPQSKDRKAYLIVHTSPIFGDDGKVAEVMEMSVDVTRMVKLQLELERKEAQVANLIENVPCYLTVIDRSFRIAFSNKLFTRDFGESWGKTCFKVFKGRDSKCTDCPVAKTFVDGATHTSEEVWHRKGQAMHIVTYTSPVVDEKGEIVAVMEMCTDVTEVKLLQNELALLGETVAGMSHAVKNILSGLEGGVYLVDTGLRKSQEDRVRTGWDMVKRNVAKVSDLVKDILYASKEREPEYQECDPGAILAEVYELYLEKAQKSGIELIQDFLPQMGSALLDPKGIHTAVSNLIANAIQACLTDGGPEKHRIILSGAIQDVSLLIKVADDGCGMPEEVRQNLFTKFYSTKGSQGTGLGLVVTHKVITEHHGTIKVESSPGNGTTFLIELPLRQTVPTEAAANA
jgi:PAS domain S-box-containing protein